MDDYPNHQKGVPVAPHTADRPGYTLGEMVKVISRIEEEHAYYQVKTHFEQQKNLYHPEQSLLMQAHLFGRFQYLQTEGKLAKVH